MNHNMRVEKPELVECLADTLGNAVHLYYKAQGHHWNVTGRDFAQFHDFFSEIYEDVYTMIDPTAENMRKLGAMAPYRLEDFANLSQMDDMDCGADAMMMVQDLYAANNVMIMTLDNCFAVASSVNEQGVADFIAARIDAHKMWRWQLAAFLSPTEADMLGKSKAVQPIEADMPYKDMPVVEQLMNDHDGCALCGPVGCVCPGCDNGYCLCGEDCACPQCHISMDIADEEYDLMFSYQEERDEAMTAAGIIVAEEQDLAAALLEIAEKHGKFNEDRTGIWAGYTSAAENEYKEIGVKCINCVLYEGPGVCKIISQPIEDDGKCRFAVIPDGVVQVEDSQIVAAATEDDSCPVATQDIQVNLENRQNAIDNVGYGPLNPKEPNEEFWQEKADKWKTTPEEAKTSVCGNCVFFVRTPKMLDCISSGLEQGDSSQVDADSAIDQAELGYCEALDFKCAASRTCNAWAVGGPITAASSRPAPKKDRIYGSKKNKPGSAAGSKKIVFSAKTETALRNKVEEHNKDAKPGRKATLPMLKAVYRRGSGAFSSSHRPGKTRDQWAMARVNAFLKLLRSGSPANPNYKQDNDLLPKAHPKSSRGEASVLQHELLQIALKSADEYGSPEHAIYSMAEYTGLGYEAIPALRGAWLRGVRDGDIPFERAYSLATKLYESKDADLLPKKRKG
jgi:starvation-inducible DNA-binding protein